MSTPQVKLSDTPSLFEARPKLAKEGAPSFAATLKPMEEALKTETKGRPVAVKDKKTVIENRKVTEDSSVKIVENKAMNEEKQAVTDKMKESLQTNSMEPSYDSDEKLEVSDFQNGLTSDEEKKNPDALFVLLSGFISELAMKIGVDEEEVKRFLSESGVTLNELLDIDTWKEFTLKIHTLNEASEILTNDKAFQDLNTISELLDKLVNSGEMKQIVTRLTDGGKDFNEIVKKFEAFMPKLLGEVVKEAEILPKNDEILTEPLSKAEETLAYQMVDKPEKEDMTSFMQEGKGSNEPNLKEGFKKNSDTGIRGENTVLPVGNKLFDHLIDSIKNLEHSAGLPEGLTARELVNQVTDQIKMLHAPDKTTLELMLQPASLGKVLINVTSKNGVMQAELKVESPEARQALMNNIADLKLSFENQGFKVEEIEVMLAETGIGGRDEGSRQEEEKKNKAKNRKIDFSVDEGGEIVMETEEKLVVNEVSGSNVDYSA